MGCNTVGQKKKKSRQSERETGQTHNGAPQIAEGNSITKKEERENGSLKYLKHVARGKIQN